MTRQSNLPKVDYLQVAIAPWLSADCTKSYLAAAQGAKAVVFYLPGQNNSDPPPMNNAVWGLDDGGSWESQNQFPVYAVPSTIGTILMQELGRYSGNMSSVEDGHLLETQFDPSYYVRLYAVINTSSQFSLPSLWVFLLIVLGVLLVIICITSTFMHFIQCRNRRDLRRRIENGEVDLEALGIKRLTVPQDFIRKLPSFVYAASDKGDEDLRQSQTRASMDHVERKAQTSPNDMITAHNGVESANDHNAINAEQNISKMLGSPTEHKFSFLQSTCPICLEDFVSHETRVRELPCHHIYHPECIDEFLKASSSLCPICKQTVLPPGYCPDKITNAMVRRERLAQRNQQRRIITEEMSSAALSRPSAARSRMASFQRQFGRTPRNPQNAHSDMPVENLVEMSTITSEQYPLDETGASRPEQARRRAAIILGRHRTIEDEDSEQQARLPKCQYKMAMRRSVNR